MGIREQINEKPAVATAVTGSILFLSLVFMAYQLNVFGLFSGGYETMDVYYEDASGKLYVGDLKDMYEENDGAFPVRAHRVRYGDGEPFIYFYERYNPGGPNDTADPFEVRHPSQDVWHSRFTSEGRMISTLQANSEGVNPTEVLPD